MTVASLGRGSLRTLVSSSLFSRPAAAWSTAGKMNLRCSSLYLNNSLCRQAMPYGNPRLKTNKLLLSNYERSVSIDQYRLKSKDKGGGKAKGGKGSKSRVHFDTDVLSEVVDVQTFAKEVDEAFQSLTYDLTTQCTVRSTAGVFDRLEVETVDGAFLMNELGTINQKSSNLIVVNMTALPNYIPDVMNSIRNSNLNVNPQQEGLNIMLPLPKVTKDHRVRLAAEAKERLESLKVDLRQIFTKYSKIAKNKKNLLSVDAVFMAEAWLKQEVDDIIAKAEKVVKEKQEEVLDTGRTK